MNSKTGDALTNEPSKTERPIRLPHIFIIGVKAENLNFVCKTLSFIYHHGTMNHCTESIRMTDKLEQLSTPTFMFYWSHIGHQSFTDYHKI